MTNTKSWSEEFDEKFYDSCSEMYFPADYSNNIANEGEKPRYKSIKYFISQKLKEQEERHKREIDNLLHSMLEREKIYSEDLKTIRSKYE
jgi:hypothetical protein